MPSFTADGVLDHLSASYTMYIGTVAIMVEVSCLGPTAHHKRADHKNLGSQLYLMQGPKRARGNSKWLFKGPNKCIDIILNILKLLKGQMRLTGGPDLAHGPPFEKPL